MNISIVGCGYVGLSIATLIAQKHDVKVFDTDKSKIEHINKRVPTVEDKEIEEFFKNKDLKLIGTSSKREAYKDAEIVVIATPTNFNEEKRYFDTSSVDSCIEDCLKINKNCLIVIKSTIPIGHTRTLKKKYNTQEIVFSPEFLREGNALKDNLFPSRIIVGGNTEKSILFTGILKDLSLKKKTDVLYTSSMEAESIKLFSNTYLAMRVAFFNEMDSFSQLKGMNSKKIIEGICLDERIGNGYNNPSFGFGGYCLPKDTRQLDEDFGDIPNPLISSIPDSNLARAKILSDCILEDKPNYIGMYRLIMKKDSDNFRSSSILNIFYEIKKQNPNQEIIIYEPLIKAEEFMGSKVIKDLELFFKNSDIIVANRVDERLQKINKKVFTRDIFNEN